MNVNGVQPHELDNWRWRTEPSGLFPDRSFRKLTISLKLFARSVSIDGKYVSCVAKTSENFVEFELITGAEKDATVSAAAQSACGW